MEEIMSQAKVDKYKQEKANRKKIMKKEKRQHVLRVILACIIGLALVGFLVWTVVDKYNESNEEQTVTLSEEEMSKLIEQLSDTTSSSEGTTSGNSTEDASGEETSGEKASDEETSGEKASDEQDTTEAAE